MNATTTVVGAITDVFTEVFGWIQSSLTSVLSVFYSTSSGLTILGVLAVVGLAISIFFLLVGVISNFFHLRG